MSTRLMSRGQKSLLQGCGVLLFLVGALLGLVFVCAALFTLIGTGSDSDNRAVLALLTLTALSLGGGILLYQHSTRSLAGRPSSKLRLPSVTVLAGLFVILVLAGLLVGTLRLAQALLLPPILLVAALLPPLCAVAWFVRSRPGGLTWRRGSVAFFLGATVSAALALILEIVAPLLFLNVLSSLSSLVGSYLQAFLAALGAGQLSAALTSRGFILLFVQLAVIAPLVEEFCKPLVTLPVLRYLWRRDAFLLGALAGAGFAAIENIIYISSGFPVWAGILLVRALGAAIHPLGAGLVASGWSGVLQGEPGAWPRWLRRFGVAAGMHALWNGGSLLIITLTGVPFFGRAPQLDVLGISATGLVLAFLLVVGLAALWLGGDLANSAARGVLGQAPGTLEARTVSAMRRFELDLSDRGLALWALLCLAVVVPVGLAVVKVLNP